jgi:hypothetical protein
MHGPTHRDDNAQQRRHRAAVAVVVLIALGAFALLLRGEPAEPIALVDATTARREHAPEPEPEQASAARSKEPSARVADSQAAQLLEEVVVNRPAAQSTQLEDADAPVAAEYLPPGQPVQTVLAPRAW